MKDSQAPGEVCRAPGRMFSSFNHKYFFAFIFVDHFNLSLPRHCFYVLIPSKFFIYLYSLLGYFLGLWAERKRLEEERVKEEQEYEEEKRRREEEKEKRKEAKAKVVSKGISSRTSMARKQCFGSGCLDSGPNPAL
jgi:hypothetical protein